MGRRVRHAVAAPAQSWWACRFGRWARTRGPRCTSSSTVSPLASRNGRRRQPERAAAFFPARTAVVSGLNARTLRPLDPGTSRPPGTANRALTRGFAPSRRGEFEPPTPCLQVTRCELRCVSRLFIYCCLSTESGIVDVAQYRAMLGEREHSAPTDAPTRSRSIRSQVRSFRSRRRSFPYKAKATPGEWCR